MLPLAGIEHIKGIGHAVAVAVEHVPVLHRSGGIQFVHCLGHHLGHPRIPPGDPVGPIVGPLVVQRHGAQHHKLRRELAVTLVGEILCRRALSQFNLLPRGLSVQP